MRSPVATLWPTLYVHAQFSPGSILEVPPDHEERAVYVVHGDLAVGDQPVTAGELAVFEPGTAIELRAHGSARAMLLGGGRIPTPRYIWWNFVASSQERIERAKQRWELRQFPAVPGETEFIPLPTY